MENKIPFVKPVRVGNYKLWRSKIVVGSGKDKTDIEVVNVSSLDGTFKVQIPATSDMYGLICQQYADESDKSNEFLTMLFANFINICLSANPALHDGLFFLTEMLSFPYLLLTEKEMVKRMKAVYKETGIGKKDAEKQIADMVEYRKKVYELIEEKKSRFLEDYERIQAERRAKEDDAEKALEQDEIAEQAINELNDKTS